MTVDQLRDRAGQHRKRQGRFQEGKVLTQEEVRDAVDQLRDGVGQRGKR